MNIKAICGSGLAYIVGIARISGGVISINSSTSDTETGVGIGLIAVGIFILLSITMLLVRRSMFWFTMLSLSVILFWVGGIINGFLLFGHPQMSGQIINICCVMVICMLTYSLAKSKNLQGKK